MDQIVFQDIWLSLTIQIAFLLTKYSNMPECSFLSCCGYREGLEMDPLMLQPTWTVTVMVIELPGMFGDGCHLFFMVPCSMVETLKFEEQRLLCSIFCGGNILVCI